MRRSLCTVTAVLLGLLCAQGCGNGLSIPPTNELTEASATQPRPDRLLFLLEQDSTRAIALDSPYDPLFSGIGPLDPPYEPGANLLTVLGNVGGSMLVEQTIPLGLSGVAYIFCLAPGGDTALCAAYDPVGNVYRLFVVRGLRDGSGHLEMSLTLVSCPSCIAFSPDGRSALVGGWTPGRRMDVTVVSGLPDEPALAANYELGDYVIARAHIYSIDVSLDGERALFLLEYHDCDEGPPSATQQLQVAYEPFDPDRVHLSEPLAIPEEPAIPATPPFEGELTGYASEATLLLDGDCALVPSTGWPKRGQFDAQIHLVRGVRSGELRIERTLGPEDGVGICAFQAALAPDADTAVVTNIMGSVSVLQGLSSGCFDDVTLTTTPMGRYMGEPAITPDGRTLLIASGMAPVDGSPPAEVSNHRFMEGPVTSLGPKVFGPVRKTPFWTDSNFMTVPPGLVDYVNVFTKELHPAVAQLLRDRVHSAVSLADSGRDEEARAALEEFCCEVAGLRCAGQLNEVQAGVLDDLARTGQRVLE